MRNSIFKRSIYVLGVFLAMVLFCLVWNANKSGGQTPMSLTLFIFYVLLPIGTIVSINTWLMPEGYALNETMLIVSTVAMAYVLAALVLIMQSSCPWLPVMPSGFFGTFYLFPGILTLIVVNRDLIGTYLEQQNKNKGD